MNTSEKNENGLAELIVILFLSIIIGLVAYWYLNLRQKPASTNQVEDKTILIKKTKESTVEEPEQEMVHFEEVNEDESTPEEINNEVLEELDEIILSLDEEDEDLSDL